MLSSRPRGACPILLLVRLSVIFSILSYISTSLASPLAVRPTHLSSLSKRYISTRANGLPSPKIGDGGPAESDYPNDDQIRGAFIPPAGPLVFFSGLPDPQNNQAPFEFTKTVPGATILRGAFPKAYITRKPQGGPRRSLEWYQNFLDRASGVYTDKAVEKGETVFFVGTWDAQVRDCSIWNTIELPTLKAAGIPVTLVDYAISRTRGITQGPIPRILSIPFSNLRRNVTKWVIWTSLRREIPGSASIGLALARMPMIRTLTRAWIQGTILVGAGYICNRYVFSAQTSNFITYFPLHCWNIHHDLTFVSLQTVPKERRPGRHQWQTRYLRLPFLHPDQRRQSGTHRSGRLLRRSDRTRRQC